MQLMKAGNHWCDSNRDARLTKTLSINKLKISKSFQGQGKN